jgi:hydrogenase maturation protease
LDCLNSDDESLTIILDAAISGKEPGTVTKFTINDMALCTSRTFSAHNQELIGATLRQTNYTNLLVIGIEPETVDFKWGISDTLSNAFMQIITDVKKCLLSLELE